MMVMYIKRHLRNIWSSFHEKVKNTESELRKALLIKSVYIQQTSQFSNKQSY